MLGRLTSALPIALVLLATPVSGQGLYVGLAGGLNRATYRMGSAGDQFSEHRLGLVGGIVLGWDLSQVWALELEALYTEKGFTGGSGSQMHLDYVEIPILIRATLPLVLGRVRPVLHAGVAPAREVRCRGWLTGSYSSYGLPPPAVRQSLNCSLNRTRLWDVGAVGGAGFAVGLGDLTLTVESRYSAGLADLYPISDYTWVKNRALSILLTGTLRVF